MLDRTRHAAPQVFERLRDMIVALVLAPGAVLSRPDLARQFGVSQTPVREALIRLAEEGLVDIFPQHATKVSRINLTAARQAHFLRRSLELEIVRTLAEQGAAGATSVVQDLQALVDQQHLALEASDLARFSALDQRFHRRMYEAAGVEDLWHLQRRLSGHIDRLRSLHLPLLGKATTILADHQGIIDAIAAGDGAAAQARLRQHLSGTLARIEDISARFPDYVRA
ncbi:MAG: GntR family transcriptional regulator [Alphaproteobacteria bacterium]|nr:GntR family transcriptional regulator [Alphaproteobacteria bacterium]